MKYLIIILFLSFWILGNSQNQVTKTYDYDMARRLTSVTYNDSIQIKYAYDLNGNMINRSVQRTESTRVPSLMQEKVWEIYPNPTPDHIFIQSKEVNPDRIQVYSVHGQLIFEKEIIAKSSLIQFSIAGLADGIYSLRIVQRNHSELHKIVKL